MSFFTRLQSQVDNINDLEYEFEFLTHDFSPSIAHTIKSLSHTNRFCGNALGSIHILKGYKSLIKICWIICYHIFAIRSLTIYIHIPNSIVLDVKYCIGMQTCKLTHRIRQSCNSNPTFRATMLVNRTKETC